MTSRPSSVMQAKCVSPGLQSMAVIRFPFTSYVYVITLHRGDTIRGLSLPILHNRIGSPAQHASIESFDSYNPNSNLTLRKRQHVMGGDSRASIDTMDGFSITDHTQYWIIIHGIEEDVEQPLPFREYLLQQTHLNTTTNSGRRHTWCTQKRHSSPSACTCSRESACRQSTSCSAPSRSPSRCTASAAARRTAGRTRPS